MNEFDMKAAGWDSNPMHTARSKAVAEHIRKLIPLNNSMTALEFGAGTGITSLLLADSLAHITMMDNSAGMVEMMNEKLKRSHHGNLKAEYFDLEKQDYKGGRFDLIFTQMVLHHVRDVNQILRKFSQMLNQGGYIAIADLYPEDGSFHGEGFNGHKGFDPKELQKLLERNNFINPVFMTCFTIEKETGHGTEKFDIFIIAAQQKGINQTH